MARSRLFGRCWVAKVPQPRKAGQTGGGGRIGQTGNRNASSNRGGRPHAGGGGSGKKPPGNGCVVLAFAMAGGAALAAYGVYEAVRGVVF